MRKLEIILRICLKYLHLLQFLQKMKEKIVSDFTKPKNNYDYFKV